MSGQVYEEPLAETVEELEQRVGREWDELHPGLLKRTLHQVRLRARAIVNANGEKLNQFR